MAKKSVAIALPAAHLSLPNQVESWLLEPGGMLNIIHGTADKHVAAFISETVDAEMKRLLPASRYVFIHDFSQSSGYTTVCRKMLTQWGVRSRAIVASVVCLYPKQNAVYEMGIEMAAALLRLAGVPMTTAATLEEALARTQTRIHTLAPAQIFTST